MNSRRQQPPEYIGRNGRIIFNAIGQNATRFHVYDDGAAYAHMHRKPFEPRFNYDPSKGPRWSDHMQEFLECVRTGDTPRCNIDEAFIELVSYLMSVESYHAKRMVRWDAAKEEIV